MQTVSHAVSHIHAVNDGKISSILNKLDNANKKLNKSKCSCSDKLSNEVHPHIPINYHHSTMLPSEVNKLHHLEEASLLCQFCMANTHCPTT